MTSTKGSIWKESANSDIDSILQNHIWELVDLPLSYKPSKSKQNFKMKMKLDSSIDKYKARLVIKIYK